jgi:hypothetical protein
MKSVRQIVESLTSVFRGKAQSEMQDLAKNAQPSSTPSIVRKCSSQIALETLASSFFNSITNNYYDAKNQKRNAITFNISKDGKLSRLWIDTHLTFGEDGTSHGEVHPITLPWIDAVEYLTNERIILRNVPTLKGGKATLELINGEWKYV